MTQFDEQMGPSRPNITQRTQRGIFGSVKSYLRSDIHKAGMKGAASFTGLSGGLRGNKLMKGLMAYELYKGYKEDGVGGMVSAGVNQAVSGYAFDAILKATGLGKVAMVGLGVGAIAGVASYATGGTNPLEFLARPMVKENMRRHSLLEMGTPSVDEFGTLATMRQRSLMAIQNSRINGRSALGNEGQISYRPYFR